MGNKNVWTNKEGEPAVIFEMGGRAIKGRESCLEIFKKFIESDLSRKAFCACYQISGPKKFNDMLNNFAQESEEYAQLVKEKDDQEKMTNEKNLYLCGLVGLGKLPVEKLIGNSSELSFEEAKQVVQNKWGKPAMDALTYRVIDYFYRRLNSAKWSDASPENINKLLTFDEARFIVGNVDYYLLQMGKSSIAGKFVNATAYLNGENSELYSKKVRGEGKAGIFNALLKYDEIFIKDEYLKETTLLQTPKALVEVTPEIVDQAYNYVLENNLFPSSRTVNLAIRAVVHDNIAYSEISPERQKIINRNPKKVLDTKGTVAFLEGIDGYMFE